MHTTNYEFLTMSTTMMSMSDKASPIACFNSVITFPGFYIAIVFH